MTQKLNLSEYFWSRVNKDGPIIREELGPCWEWTGSILSEEQPYGLIRMHRKRIRAHRFSYQLHFGEIPKGLGVCHHCDNPSCIRPDHLFLGDQKANMQDATRKGRNSMQLYPERSALLKIGNNKGELHPQHKLTESDVIEIHRLIRLTLPTRNIAELFRVSETTIRQIRRGEQWSWVSLPAEEPGKSYLIVALPTEDRS